MPLLFASQIPGAGSFRSKAGDRLRISIISSVATTLSGFVRVMTNDGGVSDLSFGPEVLSGDRTAQTFDGGQVSPQDAWIVGFSALVSVVEAKRGQVYMTARIGIGAGEMTIARGYVYTGRGLSLHEWVEPGPGGGEGFLRDLQTADPAANTEISPFAVPDNAMWRPHSLRVTMAQGATQTPVPNLVHRAANGVAFSRTPIGAVIAASTTVICSWVRGGAQHTDNVTGGSITATMPDIIMLEADDLITATRGIGANSDYGVPDLRVEEWLVI